LGFHRLTRCPKCAPASINLLTNSFATLISFKFPEVQGFTHGSPDMSEILP
jgi:hypothetical protein